MGCKSSRKWVSGYRLFLFVCFPLLCSNHCHYIPCTQEFRQINFQVTLNLRAWTLKVLAFSESLCYTPHLVCAMYFICYPRSLLRSWKLKLMLGIYGKCIWFFSSHLHILAHISLAFSTLTFLNIFLYFIFYVNVFFHQEGESKYLRHLILEMGTHVSLRL